MLYEMILTYYICIFQNSIPNMHLVNIYTESVFQLLFCADMYPFLTINHMQSNAIIRGPVEHDITHSTALTYAEFRLVKSQITRHIPT